MVTHKAITSSAIESRIFRELVHTQYQTFPVTLGGSVIAVVLYSLALTLWQPVWAVSVWVVAMFLQFGVRAMVTRSYHRRCQLGPLTLHEVQAWGSYATWGSALSGSFWGVMALVFFPATGSEFAQYQYLLMMMLSGMGTAAAFAQASYPWAFRAFMLPACVPFTILLFMQGTTIHTIYGVGSILYMLSIDRFVVVLNGSILDAYHMRFVNQELVEQLSKQNEVVQQASAAKSKFLASASHDLRQPLHAMELFAEALQQTGLTQASHQITEKLRKSVGAMRSLLDTLLDISKLDAGVIKPQPMPIGLAHLLGLVHNEFNGPAQSKGLVLRVRVPPHAATHSDLALLKSVVSNLVSNAVRYTERGGILITCRAWHGQWLLDVTDTGLGIPQAQQQEVFKEFVQLHNPQRDREQGLGLGLAIVGRLCGLLGHTVEVRSEPNRGSRFRVLLPQAGLPPPDEMPGVTNGLAMIEHDALILVIDDERDVREAMHAMLTGWGLRSVCAPDAHSAVQALENESSLPLLIISDYRLGNQVNGIEAIEHVRDEYNREELPALLITGDTDSKDLIKLQQSGIAVMHKPVDTRKLKALIQQLSWERSRH